ncbi:MAG: hypothetical protein TEF_09875 [Rhizobiales bacterium NRL2]|jgi:uncharacterized protein (DUF58 family)|nr:MAG: hypothetical protein TEF_09875 [Rhizobiales bacterium NRL2]
MALAPPPARIDQRLRKRADRLAGAMAPLLVEAERVAQTVSQGVHGRRRVGEGESFWQFRRYQQGDPASWIDWRQSAKRVPTYVRQNEWEAAQAVWLWRDGSESMDFRSHLGQTTKLRRATLLTLALASLLLRGGERVAFLGMDRPPGSSRALLEDYALAIEKGLVEDHSSLPPSANLPRYAQVVLIGDFLTPLDEVSVFLRRFSAVGVGGHLLQIMDPAEHRLPYDGRVVFESPEGEGEVLIGRTETIHEEYAVRVDRRQADLRQIARSAGWTFDTHHTDQPAQAALLSLYQAISGASQ